MLLGPSCACQQPGPARKAGEETGRSHLPKEGAALGYPKEERWGEGKEIRKGDFKEVFGDRKNINLQRDAVVNTVSRIGGNSFWKTNPLCWSAVPTAEQRHAQHRASSPSPPG